ncbi:MAG: hypothetical protein J7450_09000 [Thermomicrobium sp.]|nr:hypothetical protein [Thermomicrobium sp.]
MDRAWRHWLTLRRWSVLAERAEWGRAEAARGERFRAWLVAGSCSMRRRMVWVMACGRDRLGRWRIVQGRRAYPMSAAR